VRFVFGLDAQPNLVSLARHEVATAAQRAEIRQQQGRLAGQALELWKRYRPVAK
jgi:hypothetical protein